MEIFNPDIGSSDLPHDDKGRMLSLHANITLSLKKTYYELSGKYEK